MKAASVVQRGQNQTGIVQDWLFWIKSEWISLGWRRFSCLATGFVLFRDNCSSMRSVSLSQTNGQTGIKTCSD